MLISHLEWGHEGRGLGLVLVEPHSPLQPPRCPLYGILDVQGPARGAGVAHGRSGMNHRPVAVQQH